MFAHTHHTDRALRILFTAEKGGGSGGASKSLEAQLADSQAENKRLISQVDSLTRERDSASAEVTKITGQFNEATKTATEAQAEVTKVKSELATTTADRDDKAKKLTSAEANVERLETLCGVKGVDKNAVVPAVEGPESSGGHVYDQYLAAKGAAKSRLLREHRAEIRAEATRRAGK